MRSSFAFVWWVCDVSIWHGAEGLGGATIATAIQGYNRHAERVPGMPALDPTSDIDIPNSLRRTTQLAPHDVIGCSSRSPPMMLARADEVIE